MKKETLVVAVLAVIVVIVAVQAVELNTLSIIVDSHPMISTQTSTNPNYAQAQGQSQVTVPKSLQGLQDMVGGC